MRRSLLVSLFVLGALVGLQAGVAHAAPSKGKNVEHLNVVCAGETVAVITSSSANSFWTVDTSGQTSQTPGHLKELSVRVYPGELTTEPSTEPIFTFEKSYGQRVGQGDVTHCSGHDLDSGPEGPATVFFDVEVTSV